MNYIHKNIKGCLTSLDARGPFVLAVSGGPESQALLKAVSHLCPDNCLAVGIDNPKIEAAEELAVKLKVKFTKLASPVIEGPDIYSKILQSRFKALIEFAKENDSNYILTGHNSDDQAMNILIQLFKGKQPNRMVNINYIKEENIHIVRPLLQNSRKEILKYLERHKIKYNLSNNSKSLRGWLNEDLLVKMKAKNCKIENNLTNFINLPVKFEDETILGMEL